MAFPPIPIYPKGYDNDYTLYLVRNTVETRLSADNSPWAQEVEIVPVGASEEEIWATNGFANIDGELFYYDSVGKDSNGKVNKLKGCARQIGGEDTKFNKRGTWVRSYVIAEHHNQLVDAIMKTQNFIGRQFDPRQETLDWRIRNLQQLDVIWDDYSCPDINFTFNIIENSPVTGIVAQFRVDVTPPGSISNYRLDFGDGDFTTTDIEGTHRYAINARIDPIVRVSNDKCQIIQTPIERINPAEPETEADPVFDFPVPEFPDVPDFTFVPCEVPEPDLNMPPLVIPCVSIEGQVGPIPSVITGPDINIASNIVITSNNPIQILYSTVTITGVNVPSIILLDPPVPPTIVIDPPIPPTIVIIPPQSTITLDLDFTRMPMLEVDWGTMPEMEVQMTMVKAVKTPERFAADPELVKEFGSEFSDLFEMNNTMKVQYEPANLPSEIKIVMPDDLPRIGLDTSELDNKRIKLDASGVNIPTSIQIYGPESPIPNSIRLDGTDLPEEIDLVYRGKPIPVEVEVVGMPTTMTLEHNLPTTILVEMPKPIPDRIIVESKIPETITLEGPESIPVFVPEDVFIPVKFPDIMPQVEMVWKGNPIEVKITMDQIIDKSAEGKNCVMIVPCKS
jgi:hypothetical protein